MSTYMTHFRCNYEAWPADKGKQRTAWTNILGDADDNVKDGSVKFIGWVNNTEGYALLEASSKADVIRICARFWPLFHNDIIELVPAAEAGEAILEGVAKGW